MNSKLPLPPPTVMLAVVLMAIIVMMVLPVPSWVLDMGLAASFALAILIFAVTLFIERPLDFSAFPTVLLASLMLRLSLNVSSTKLIIGQGHTGTKAAGNVIEGFANFVMGGSVFLGLVVFCVLLIVNFVVINKGATRMAEVGARFALDGMPGKQLAIDSDMSAGAIDHTEAKRRREVEQAETTFFGSLDGASKFVKGDAVAGLLITALNLIAGLAIGTMGHGMPLSSALETYAILTVGDGLVSQIPAVIISIASALLLSRGGTTGAVDLAVFQQLSKYPAALATVALLLGLFGLVPGLPFVPFVTGALALGGLAFIGYRRQQNAVSEPPDEADVSDSALPPTSLGDVLDLDDIHVEFSPDLVEMVLDPGTGLDARIANMRSHVATEFGMLLPEIRLTDNAALGENEYVIRIQGVVQATDKLLPHHVLALSPEGGDIMFEGPEVSEPVYGAPAKWIADSQQEEAAVSGLTTVNPTEVLATHLLEVTKKNFARLLTYKALQRILDEMVNLSDRPRSEANRKMLDAIIPDKVTMETLLSVLRLLLDERISIRNMGLILESIVEASATSKNVTTICEHVRQRLGFQLVEALRRPDGTIPLVQLAPEWEELFVAHQIQTEPGQTEVALPPDDFNRLSGALAKTLEDSAANGVHPAVVTASHRRRFVTTILRAGGSSHPVLSFEEIGLDARPSLVGLVAA